MREREREREKKEREQRNRNILKTMTFSSFYFFGWPKSPLFISPFPFFMSILTRSRVHLAMSKENVYFPRTKEKRWKKDRREDEGESQKNGNSKCLSLFKSVYVWCVSSWVINRTPSSREKKKGAEGKKISARRRIALCRLLYRLRDTIGQGGCGTGVRVRGEVRGENTREKNGREEARWRAWLGLGKGRQKTEEFFLSFYFITLPCVPFFFQIAIKNMYNSPQWRGRK